MDNILKEEINNHLKSLDNKNSKKFKKVMNELFLLKADKLADNIGSVEKDGNNEIASENWEWLLDQLATSIAHDEESWNEYFGKIKLAILTNKYFTKRDPVKQENLESYLKINIKPYFTALQNYVDISDFKNKVYKLPSDIAFCLVRYCFYVNEDLSVKIKVSKEDLRKNILKLKDLRLKVAENISSISKGYKNILDFDEIISLYDNGLFLEDNFINRGITEFLAKLISNENAKGKLLDITSNAVLKNIHKNIQTFPAYMNHTNDIKVEVDTNYFSSKGEQIGKKFENYLDLTIDGDFDGYVVDGESVFKEPQRLLKPVQSSMMQLDASGNPMEFDSGAGGMDLGGGSAGGMVAGGLDGDLPGGDFAEPGTEGEIPGIDDDGTPVPSDEDGLPQEFGTVEDNNETADDPDDEKK